jgi:hypothetical protein
MDVRPDKERLFNEVYDAEHIPEIRRVPGVRRIRRYRTTAPDEPRYMAVYEVDQPDVPGSRAWRIAADTGRWASEVRPYTMNRDGNRALCARVGGGEALSLTTEYVLVEMLDGPSSGEALLHEVDEADRVSALSTVSGVRNMVRFRATGEGHPRYLTLYELERPDVPSSDEFQRVDRSGRWHARVLDGTHTRHLVVYKQIAPAADR